MMTKLTWIKKRVRSFEAFDWAMEENRDSKPSRKSFIICAIEDYQWRNINMVQLTKDVVNLGIAVKAIK